MDEQTQATTAPASTPGDLAATANAANPPKPKKAKAAKAAKPAKPAKKAKAKTKTKTAKGLAVLREYAPGYVKGGGKEGEKATKTAGGNTTIDNGDKLAAKLRGMGIDAVYKEAVTVLNAALEEGEKKTSVADLKAKYGKLNVGMQRMNLGNRMRGALGISPNAK